MTVATSIALTLAIVLPVLKVLTLALVNDSSCRSFFFYLFCKQENNSSYQANTELFLKQNEKRLIM